MIPAWSPTGLLPPVRDGLSASQDRSPYKSNLFEVIERFATTSERIKILEGFLNYRKALHQTGLIAGFQWLDGSFSEDVETRENRSPNDMDVVTFWEHPTADKVALLNENGPALFSPSLTKERYSVDAYDIQLGIPTDNFMAKQIAYWYSIWSHTRKTEMRQSEWKGFLEVSLSPDQDAEAASLLIKINKERG